MTWLGGGTCGCPAYLCGTSCACRATAPPALSCAGSNHRACRPPPPPAPAPPPPPPLTPSPLPPPVRHLHARRSAPRPNSGLHRPAPPRPSPRPAGGQPVVNIPPASAPGRGVRHQPASGAAPELDIYFREKSKAQRVVQHGWQQSPGASGGQGTVKTMRHVPATAPAPARTMTHRPVRLRCMAPACLEVTTPHLQSACPVPWPALRQRCADADRKERAAKSVFVHVDGRRCTSPALIGLMYMLERTYPQVGYFHVIAAPRPPRPWPPACDGTGRGPVRLLGCFRLRALCCSENKLPSSI